MITKKTTCGAWGAESLGKIADRVSGNLDTSQDATAERMVEYRNPTTVWNNIQRQLFDSQVVVKKAIRKYIGGKRAEKIIQSLEKSPGGSAKGLVEAQIELQRIFDGMPEEQVYWFNKMVVARRAISIDEHSVEVARKYIGDKGFGVVYDQQNDKHVDKINSIFGERVELVPRYIVVEHVTSEIKKGAKKTIRPRAFATEHEAIVFSGEQKVKVLEDAQILHPGGDTAEDYKILLESMKERNPETYATLEIKLEQYFDVYREQLVHLYDAGIINKSTYDHMAKVGDYSPRRYLKFFDPDISADMLAGLTTGSKSELNTDSANLLREYIIRLHSRIARNRANTELYYTAVENPDNGLITIVDETIPDEDIEIGANFKVIKARVGGLEKKMTMPLKFGKSWMNTDPALDEETARIWRTISGANMVRALATGYNPEFAITNLPRDILFSWFRTREYSDHGFKAFPQIAKRMAETFNDVWHTGDVPIGRAKEFLDEYGMMDFMTTQGEFGGKAWRHEGGKMDKGLRGLGKMLSFVGSKTELWVRLSLREQAIINRVADNNGVETQGIRDEATWIARGYLDFSQGGKMIKGADAFVPYLNAGMQATRGMFETLSGGHATGKKKSENIQMAWYKMAQFFGVFSFAFLYNMFNHPEEWDKIDDSDKFKNLIMFVPGMKDKDKNGNDIFGFAKLPLDQGQTAIANLFGLLFTGMLRETIGTEGDSHLHKIASIRPDVFKEGINYGIPLQFGSSLPPTVRAIWGYFFNFDTYRGDNVYKGPKMKNLGNEMAGRTPFDHPALTMSVQKLNQILPNFFGLIPDEPFSPARMKFVIDTFFVPSNSAVRAIGGAWDSLVSPHLRPEEIRKMDEGIARDVRAFYKKWPGVDRVFEWTHGESVEAVKRNEEIKMGAAEKQVAVRNGVKGFMTRLNQAPDGDFELQEKYIRAAAKVVNEAGLDPNNRQRFMKKIIDAKKIKRSAGTLKSPRFWYTIGGVGDPIVRAEMIHLEILRNPENKKELMTDFRKLIAVHPSYEKTRTILTAMLLGKWQFGKDK